MTEKTGFSNPISEPARYFSLPENMKNRTRIQKILDFAAVPAHDDKCSWTRAGEGGIKHRYIPLHFSP
jgi:hypothetical protein